ncbi:MAG: flagellar biosynthetic protein FliR [Paracoccaceae bacterium]
MTVLFSDITAIAASGAWAIFAVFLRTSAIVAMLPAFGEMTVPARVKIMLALGFTLLVAPAAPASLTPATPVDALHVIWSEILIGLALGLSLRLFVIVLQTAGTIAAQSTSLAQVAGVTVEPVPAMSNLLVIAGLALAVTLGLHVKAVHFIVASYVLFPIGQLPDAAALSDWGVSRIAAAFRLAFSLAAPFAVAAFIYNLTLGVINRAMPQLMVAFVGAPLTTFGGLFLLFLCAPFILTHWQTALDTLLGGSLGVRP